MTLEHTSITVPDVNKIHLFVCICVVKDMLKRNEYMLETRISQATSTRKASYRHISSERFDYITYRLHTNKTRYLQTWKSLLTDSQDIE